MSEHVSWMLHLQVQAGQLTALRALMTEMVAATEADEPGTLAYEWFLSPEGTTCHLYECYADSDAAMVHIGHFGAKFAERFLAALAPTEVTVYGPASPAVREALAGFGAVHLEAAAGFRR
jgi:quinol monooxygenase YgiN